VAGLRPKTISCLPVHTLAVCCGTANGAGRSLRQVPGSVPEPDAAIAVGTTTAIEAKAQSLLSRGMVAFVSYGRYC
jgi:hypothetical protein